MTTNIRTFFSASAITGIAALATLSFLTVPTYAGTEPGYSHDTSFKVKEAWMSHLPDSMKISYMSIPGTHDSLASTGGDLVLTQVWDLGSQLTAGIRVLDFRIHFSNNMFVPDYGISGNFDTEMQTIINFLQTFPSETVFLRIKDQSNGIGNNVSFEDAFKVYYSTYNRFFWKNPSNETNPTLGELRGKVVVLQDFVAKTSYGLIYSSFNAQDYNLTTNWDQYTKWTDVQSQLSLANAVGQLCFTGAGCVQILPGNENKLYINYLSATGVFPYFVASGKSDSATGGPLLATGKTTPAWNGWPDFPRTYCVASLCTIAFEGTNNLTYQWLAAGQRKRVGFVMVDFPSNALIDHIIALNQAAVNGF